MAQAPVSSTINPVEEAARRASAKAFARITWFLVLCYVMAYLDRINIGFANLTMSADLGLTATVFGIANSVFFIAYAAFEIPSSMALGKFGARAWIPRILITWGIASCLTMFATGPNSLYVLRFLVGAAEAGLLPGVMLYLSYWFSEKDRARANGFFIMGMPLAALIGAPISGALLRMDDIGGLHGWQWLFLIEGLPSIALGIFGFFYLVDRPKKAKWLTEEEKNALETTLERERQKRAAATASHKFQWREVANWTVLLLALAYFCDVANNNTTGLWTPLVVREVLGNTDDVFLVAMVSAIMPLFAVIVLPLWSWNSDRRQERVLHLSASLAMTALGWIIMALASAPALKLVGLTLATVGGWTFLPVFWALAAPMISPASRPAAFGFIAMVGNFGSILSPAVIGWLRDMTSSFTAGFWYVAALQILGLAALALSQRFQRKREIATEPAA